MEEKNIMDMVIRQPRHRLTRIVAIGFILAGIILAGLSVLVGYIGFENSIIKVYGDSAYMVADQAASLLDGDMLERYIDICKTNDKSRIQRLNSSPSYKKTQDALSSLRSNMKLNDVYVVYTSAEELRSYNGNVEGWTPFHYIFDSYINEEETFQIGDSSKVNPDYIEVLASAAEGVRSEEVFYSKSDFGENATIVIPYKNGKDETIALIGVEIPMVRLTDEIKTFSARTLSTTMVSIIVVMLIFVYFLQKRVINLIDKIAQEAIIFGQQGDKVSENLLNIKTGDEIEVLSKSIYSMEKGILNYIENIEKITAEKERIGAELELATKIQADMLPNIFPAFPEREDFDICASMTPAKEVGGDFYDFFLIDNDHLGLVMADVSGKGVPAALFMMMSKILISNFTMIAGPDASPAKVLEQVNDTICSNNKEDMFVTVWLGIVTISTGHCVAANAGHEYPMIRKADGQFELFKDPHGFVIGGMEGMIYSEYEFTLEKGGTLFLYTDGVPEATNANNELYEMERALAALNQAPDASPKELLQNVKADVDRFNGDAPQFDDLTMLAIKLLK